MPAFPVAAPGTPSQVRMMGIHRDDLDPGFVQPQIELAAARLAKARLDTIAARSPWRQK